MMSDILRVTPRSAFILLHMSEPQVFKAIIKVLTECEMQM